MWNGHIGLRRGPILLRIGTEGEVPLLHVKSAARAVLDAACSDATGVMNFVDDNLPERGTLARWIASGDGPKLTVPISWPLMETAARLVPGPGLLRPETLAARMKPLRYSNARARAALPWEPVSDHEARLLAAMGSKVAA